MSKKDLCNHSIFAWVWVESLQYFDCEYKITMKKEPFDDLDLCGWGLWKPPPRPPPPPPPTPLKKKQLNTSSLLERTMKSHLPLLLFSFQETSIHVVYWYIECSVWLPAHPRDDCRNKKSTTVKTRIRETVDFGPYITASYYEARQSLVLILYFRKLVLFVFYIAF